jgi:ABC-type nickel/cobalt efflux system permease component RcnA
MKRSLIPFLAALALTAHPMGNFSVSHFTKFDVQKKVVSITYVLDLAEIPTYQLMRAWNLDPAADAKIPPATLDEKAKLQAADWIKQLDFASNGVRLTPKQESTKIKLSDGAGGMHVSRIETELRLDNVQGKLSFEDRNYPDRAGWKEIVIASSDATPILQASQSGADRSKALTEYPQDPTLTPPQDLRANIEWHVEAPVIVTKIVPIEQPAPPVIDPAPKPQPVPGEVTRGDYLSRMLSQKDIPFNIMLIGLAVAFAFGALHAKSPGHGKTMVAAYLVGSRGTMKQAAFLGGMVTLTHTISVFILGLVTLAFAKYLAPEKLVTWLGVASGISIILIGATLFFKRLRVLNKAKAHAHHHHHDHAHAHAHAHGLPHTHDHHHDHDHHDHDHHDHDHHDHDHGPHGHSHVPEGEVSLKSLIALGASGGMVPCPSALVLLLISISLGHVGLGLLLLVSFSLGLAGVLMAIGMLVIYAKQYLPDPVKTSQHPAFRLIPVLSAFVIVCIGLVMTGVSLGWLKPGALLS